MHFLCKKKVSTQIYVMHTVPFHFILGYSDYRSDTCKLFFFFYATYICSKSTSSVKLRSFYRSDPIWPCNTTPWNNSCLLWQPSSLGSCSIIWYIDSAKPKSGSPAGPGCSKPDIKLTQDEREFLFEVCDFAVRFSVHSLAIWFLKILKKSSGKHLYTEILFN